VRRPRRPTRRDPWRSPGLRLSNMAVAPAVSTTRHDRIQGVTLMRKLTQPGRPKTIHYTFGAPTFLRLPSHPASRRRSCLRIAVASGRPRKGLASTCSPPIAQSCPANACCVRERKARITPSPRLPPRNRGRSCRRFLPASSRPRVVMAAAREKSSRPANAPCGVAIATSIYLCPVGRPPASPAGSAPEPLA